MARLVTPRHRHRPGDTAGYHPVALLQVATAVDGKYGSGVGGLAAVVT